MSGKFNSFLRAPFFKDTIQNYIIYKITGNCEGNIRKIKKNNNVIMEKEVIEFLSNNLFQEYNDEVVNIPSKTFIRQFFESYFKIAANYVVSLIKDENKIDVFHKIKIGV